jgi:hypothetical protein
LAQFIRKRRKAERWTFFTAVCALYFCHY